jgi:hypothetical protein
MRKVVISAVVSAAVTLGALTPTPARAWDAPGHLATGDIAYDTLSASHPKTVAAIVAIMRDHPDRALFEQRLAGLSGKARERRLFALMAVWPDDARGTPQDHPEWHYALKVVAWTRFVFPFQVGGADKAFRDKLAIARDPKAPGAQRAIALCWVMHLVGDLHQPLHTGHWLSWTYPKTDRGGTIAYVRPQPGGAPISIHYIWDMAPNRPAPNRYADADMMAARVEKSHPRPPHGDLKPDLQASLHGWQKESWDLAKAEAYRDGAIKTDPVQAKAPPLPAGYTDKMRGIADTRIAKAGYRLAEVLALLPT